MRGRIPAVIYRAGHSTPLSLNTKEVGRLLRSTARENTLITLRFSEGNKVVILRDYQRDPITGNLLHVDFFEVALDERIALRIPVETMGTSLAVKEGGRLQIALREVHIRCLPALIPDRIVVDISGLKLNHALHVKDLVLDAGIEVLDDPNQSVVSVTKIISEEALTASLAGTPKEGETTAPEVTGQKTEDAAGKGAAKTDAKPDAKGAGKGKAEPKKEGKK